MRKFGDWGEEKALDYLRKKGFRVLARNYSTRFGELDLIVKRGKTLVFCEVKTRKNQGKIQPFESVTRDKQKKIKISASDFLQKTKEKYTSVRFDVVTVVGSEDSYQIEHIENAFD